MKRGIQVSRSTELFSDIKTNNIIHKMKLLAQQRNFLVIFSLLVIVILTGCAKNEVIDQCLTGHRYGFFGGLWHGFIAPFDFIGMLFNKEITMFAPNNNGGFYALGFLLGSGGWGFFGSKGVNRVQRRQVNIQSQKFDDAEIVE
jgi:hypothetical protein